MNTAQVYDVVCIGNYTKDTIITPAGTTHVDGGAVNYAAQALARLGLKIAVVTRLAKEDDRVVKNLHAAGVECFATYSPQSTCMKLEYPTQDPDIRTLSVPSTAGTITGSDVNGIQSRAAVIGSSLRGEVGLDVIRALKEKGIVVAVDVQGFVRVLKNGELTKEPWPEMQETLALADIVKSDAVEAEFLTGATDIYKAAAFYAALGPREIVLTHKDGLLIHACGEFHALQFYPARLNGRSGRGDTCVATYVGMRLSKPPKEAGIWAAALTSLKMEKQGPFDRTRADVEQLIHSKYNGASRA
jgi:sugar/nucleoside kinase (ribokinase family)